MEVVDPLDDAVLERRADARGSRRSRGAARTRTGRRRRRAGTRARRTSPRAAGSTSASLTPPTRHASIWQTSIALGLEQLLEDHAVLDVLAGRDADRRDRARGCARGRARRRGSSAPRSTRGRTRASRAIAAIASSTPQTWFASIIRACRRGRSRRGSVRHAAIVGSRSRPTFIFTCGTRRRRASRTSGSTFASS